MISKYEYILRFQVDMNFGGHYSGQWIDTAIMLVLEREKPGHRGEITFQVFPDDQWQSQGISPKPMF